MQNEQHQRTVQEIQATREFMVMLSTVLPDERVKVLEGFTMQLSNRLFGEHRAS